MGRGVGLPTLKDIAKAKNITEGDIRETIPVKRENDSEEIIIDEKRKRLMKIIWKIIVILVVLGIAYFFVF